VVWVAAILFGGMTLLGGLAVSAFYLVRVRGDVAAAEDGRLDVGGSEASSGGGP
jgi:hypothetical protein